MPRVQMTPTAKVALFFLRVYLLAMVILIVVKFIKAL